MIQKKYSEQKDDDVIFEGDMIVKKKEVEQITTEGKLTRDNTDSTVKKLKTSGVIQAITAHKSMKWPGGVVPYYIDPKLRCEGTCLWRGASKEIRAAMKEWSAKTCIKFRPKEDSDRNWVHFKSSKFGHCAAHIGKVGGEQFVYLGKMCRNKGIILHEIGHALGFFHEQSRPDRDDYVKIHWKNISKKHWHNFKKYTTFVSDMGTKYDYDSIMHYGKREFKKWYKLFSVTISPLKRLPPKVKLGQRKYVSCLDAKEMNLYYTCPARYLNALDC